MLLRVVVLAPILAAAIGFAQESGQPACTARLAGSFWPAEANRSPRLAVRLSREGTLQICGRGSWRYRWSLVSINAKRYLARTSEPRARAGAPAASADRN